MIRSMVHPQFGTVKVQKIFRASHNLHTDGVEDILMQSSFFTSFSKRSFLQRCSAMHKAVAIAQKTSGRNGEDI